METPFNNEQPAGASSDNETTQTPNTQTENANISTSADSNIQAEAWRGDPRFFQEGKKAGTLKPAFREPGENAKKPREAGGIDAEKPSTAFKGLNVAALKRTESSASPDAAPVDKKLLKAEKKLADAKTGAKIAMRVLDLLCGFIGGEEFGRGWSTEEAKRRNDYRDTLEQDWETYLQTVDIPMHPGLIVALGSTTYIAEAFKTEKAQKRVAGWKEKLGGFIFKKIL